ncbi:MAG: hypothetical protein AAF184_08640 [Pseudomonadota bacterium]
MLATLVVGCTPGVDADPSRLAGHWQASEVLLLRGDLEEHYAFTVHLGESLTDGTLDIRYYASDRPGAIRTIRQDLALTIDDAGQLIVLAGSAPRLVAGPAIEGVYAPDTFTCSLDAEAAQSTLPCRWGSEAQANAVRFTLTKVP